VFSLFSRQGKHSLGLPFYDGETVSMDKAKINKLSGNFRDQIQIKGDAGFSGLDF
jgi:hypothetical protein